MPQVSLFQFAAQLLLNQTQVYINKTSQFVADGISPSVDTLMNNVSEQVVSDLYLNFRIIIQYFYEHYIANFFVYNYFLTYYIIFIVSFLIYQYIKLHLSFVSLVIEAITSVAEFIFDVLYYIFFKSYSFCKRIFCCRRQ
jgi:hypothetical protein